MKLPPRNSRQMAIIETLREVGQLTLGEGIALHGLPRRVTVADMADLYEELVTMGCLARTGLHYRLSARLIDYYAPDRVEVEAVPALPAAARTAPPFRPLSRRYLVSSRGTREGSNDLRAAASYYGPANKA